MAAEPKTEELTAEIIGIVPMRDRPNRQRLIGRVGDSGFQLFDQLADEEPRRIGPVIDWTDAVALAADVLAGCMRAQTAPGTINRLAVALVGLHLAVIDRRTPRDDGQVAPGQEG